MQQTWVLLFNDNIHDSPRCRTHPSPELSHSLFMCEDVCLIVRRGLHNQETVAEANSYRNDTDLIPFSLSCLPSHPLTHSHSLPPSLSANSSIVCFAVHEKQRKSSILVALFLHLSPPLLPPAPAAQQRYKIQYLSPVLWKHKSRGTKWSDGRIIIWLTIGVRVCMFVCTC